MTEEEKDKWFSNNSIFIDYYEKRTKIDFSAQINLISHQMERLSAWDEIRTNKGTQRFTTLRKYKLEIGNSLINPFKDTTN